MRPRLTPDPTPPAERCGSRWWDAPGELRGINLRSLLVLQLAEARGSLTVAELVDRADAAGWRLDGRASKTISDALRWEVARGRAVRLDRGRYACGGIAKTTRHRMRRRLAACQARAARRAGCGQANHTVDDLLTHEEQLLDGLNPEERSDLTRLLRRLLGDLEARLRPPA